MNRLSAILAIFLFNLAGCGGKNCTQPVTMTSVFKNTTSLSQDFQISFHQGYGKIESRQVSVPASEESQKIVLGQYSYDKTPYYHGKVDFTPKNPSCEQMEYQSEDLQLSDPQSESFKLCHTLLPVVGGEDPIYLVHQGQNCPQGTSELQRW